MLTASCQAAISAMNSATVGQYWRINALIFMISCAAFQSDWRTPIGPSRRGSAVKLSLCNEVIRELPFDRQCALAAGLGYRGLEVAPFTFGDDGWRMPAAKRAEIRRACRDAGIEVSGLHWLLAAPAGLSITTRRPHRLAEERRCAARLGRSLRRTGRRLSRARLAGAAAGRAIRPTRERAEEAWTLAAEAAQKAGVVYCLEPLADAGLQLHQHAGRGRRDVVRRIGNPAFKTMVDTLGGQPDGARAGGRRHPALDADRPDGAYPAQRPQQARTGAGRRQIRAGHPGAARNRL